MGCAVVHGPWVENFAAPYATLAAAGGALQVQGASDLAQALASMNGQAQARQTSAAAHILSGLGNGAQLFHEILTLLSPEPAKISLHQGENVAERKQ